MKKQTAAFLFFVTPLVILLVGCSAANKVGGWFGRDGESAAEEVAYVPPSTAAPMETKVYQSESYQSSGKGATSKSGSDWGLEGLEPEPKSVPIGTPATGDIGHVQANPPVLGTTQGYSGAATQPASAQSGIYRGGNAAPRIYAKTFDGQVFDSAQHLGKVVLVDFWFRKCQPCVRALPHVDKLRQTYSKEQLTIVAVNNDESKSTAVTFLNRNAHDWPQIFDKETRPSLVSTYGVKLFPTFVVIDQLGNVQYQGSSVATAAAKVAELIQIPSAPATTAPIGVVASGNRPG